MKIVITDVATVCSEGVSLDIIKQYGEVTAYDSTTQSELKDRLRDADILLCNKTKITREVMESAKNLKYIGLFATGYNNIDIDAAKELGIRVCNAGSYSTDAVAQQTFAFVLNAAVNLVKYNEFCHDGGWISSPTFSPFVFPTVELKGKVLGIVGFGAIAKAVTKLAHAFSMRVVCYTRTPKEAEGVEFVSFDEMLALSDFISVHCPLNEQTAGLFGRETFAKCKDGAYFINTSRGPVVDEEALKQALISGKLSGAAVDVLCVEPMDKNCPLKDAPNLVITPHTAWAPIETRLRLLDIVCANIKGFLENNPQNVIV